MPSSSCWSMVMILYCLTWSSVRLVEGYQDANGKWMECPEGYELRNNMCQKNELCQEGYFLHTDGLCYLINPLPCPNNTTEIAGTTTEEPTTTTEENSTAIEEPTTTEKTTTTTTTGKTTTTTEKPTTTTTEIATTTTEVPTKTTEDRTTTTTAISTNTTEVPNTTTEDATTTTSEKPSTTTEEATTTTSNEITLPIAPPSEDIDEQVRCPPGSIFFDEQCRRIICTRGEYHAGRCLSPACPRGTVWRNKSCQTPGYITTILEIDNVIKNRHEYHTVTENVNRVEYVTVEPYDPNRDKSFKTTLPSAELIISTSTPAYSSEVPPSGCCLVKSPRFCRPYAPTWVCFNRSQKLCDPRICTHSVIYLKPPEIVQLTEPPMLVMPPNPPLSSCLTSDCLESEMLDCSGCALGKRESCSTGCYNYFCPGDSCQFKRTEDFCKLYPGGFGCKKSDGCIWEWCNKNCR